MDFGDLIILLILLAPLLKRLFGKEQKPPARSQGTLLDDHPALVSRPEQDPLAEALRQIREALAEPEPTPPAASAPVRPQPPPRTERISEFHALGSFEHDEHGFGRSNPLSEEVFEQRGAAVISRSTTRIKQQALKKVDLNQPIEVTRGGSTSLSDVARMLTDETRLREAFVMKEILAPPRSMHRGR